MIAQSGVSVLILTGYPIIHDDDCPLFILDMNVQPDCTPNAKLFFCLSGLSQAVSLY